MWLLSLLSYFCRPAQGEKNWHAQEEIILPSVSLLASFCRPAKGEKNGTRDRDKKQCRSLTFEKKWHTKISIITCAGIRIMEKSIKLQSKWGISTETRTSPRSPSPSKKAKRKLGKILILHTYISPITRIRIARFWCPIRK